MAKTLYNKPSANYTPPKNHNNYGQTVSFTLLRRYLERWSWLDPLTGERVIGFKHPQTAKDVRRVSCYIKFLTKSGHVDCGNVICIATNTTRHQRKVQFVNSGEIRVVNDILVMEIDGIKVITH